MSSDKSNDKKCGVDKKTAPLAVTLLSGFLGSGKTSVVKHILANRAGIRCAVIVNEITEENMDAYALGGTTLLHKEERLVEMSNGCVCCTLREDLIKQLRELAAADKYDCVLIESSGISEPLQVAKHFLLDLDDGLGPLNDVARLDTCVTVVDASTMLDRLKNEVRPDVHGPVAQESDGVVAEHSIGRLLAEQIEFANVVVLNKVDKLGAADAAATVLPRLLHVARQLNPMAEIIPAEFCRVPLDRVLNTGKFSHKFAESVTGWGAEPAEAHTPETEEYGVRSFVFRAARPFHPKRLHDWITSMWVLDEGGLQRKLPGEHHHQDDHHHQPADAADAAAAATTATTVHGDDHHHTPASPPSREQLQALRKVRFTRYGGEILRCKGFFYVGNPARLPVYYLGSAAGDTFDFAAGGLWEEYPVRGSAETIEAEPCQRVAFLGQYLDKPTLVADLNALLLTDEEDALLNATMAKLAEKMNDESYDDEQDEEYPTLFEDPFNALVSELVDEEDEEGEEGEEDVDEEEDDDDDNAAAAIAGVKPKIRRARDE